MDTRVEKFVAEFVKARDMCMQLSLDQSRKISLEIFTKNVPLEPVQKVIDKTIPVNGGTIPIRITLPKATGPLPILVYFHGGGWAFGSIEQSDAFCRKLTNRSGCIVVSVGYRLAPEHKFPIPLEDCYAATLWVKQHAQEFSGDANRIAVSGDSAGGNLAAGVTLMARDRGDLAIKYQLLIYPVTTSDIVESAYANCRDKMFMPIDAMRFFWDSYLKDAKDGESPYASPLKAKDLTKLPPAFIVTAEHDPMRDEGEKYAKRLQEAGVPVTQKRYFGVIHGFLGLPIVNFEPADKATQEIASALSRALQR